MLTFDDELLDLSRKITKPNDGPKGLFSKIRNLVFGSEPKEIVLENKKYSSENV